MSKLNSLLKFSTATLLVFSTIVIGLNSQTPKVQASGGKNDECEDAQVRSYESGGSSQMSYSAPDGKIVDGVCIKSGVNMFGDKHSGSLDNGTYEDGCYLIEGVGTSNLTVKRLKDGPNCQGLSHLDIYTSDTKQEDPEPTPTQEPGQGGDPEQPEDEPKEESNDSSHGYSDDNNDNNDSSQGEVLGDSTTVLPSTGKSLTKTVAYALLAIGLTSLEGIYLFKRLKGLHLI